MVDAVHRAPSRLEVIDPGHPIPNPGRGQTQSDPAATEGIEDGRPPKESRQDHPGRPENENPERDADIGGQGADSGYESAEELRHRRVSKQKGPTRLDPDRARICIV